MLSIIVPVYRSRETIAELYLRLKNLNLPLEILFINDASPDSSLQELQKLAQIDPAVRIISFTKNSGQHRAVLAGLQASRGNQLVILDADLQDPPEAIPALLQQLETGYDAVFAGRRGLYQSRLRLLTSMLFKFCLHKLCNVPRDGGMFVALTRKMANTLQTIPMKHPYIVSLIGLSQLPITSIPIERTQRPQGKSAYTSWMRLMLALSILYHTARAKQM
jgi:glycosyltransferase involved in cell wall biosynthesis